MKFERWALMIMLVSAGCGTAADDRGNPDVDAGAPSDIPAESGLSLGTEVLAGPRLKLTALVDGEKAWITVKGGELGSLLGLSYHFRYDKKVFEATPGEQANFLGLANDTRMLLQHDAVTGDIALGGTRIRPSEGNAEVADGETLFQLTLTGSPGSSGDIAIVDAYARTADGTWVVIGVESGELRLGKARDENEVSP